MQSIENKVNQFFENIGKAYEDVDLYLSEIEESLSIINRNEQKNQALIAKLQKKKKVKPEIIYKRKSLKVEIKEAIADKIRKPFKRPSKLRRLRDRAAGNDESAEACNSGAKSAAEEACGSVAKSATEEACNSGAKSAACDSFALPLKSVAVIIPTCTSTDSPDTAVKSVLAQKGVDVQVLIGVNGGNRSLYEELCDKYAANQNVYVAYTETPGAAAGCNACEPEISCDYVFYLDGDDYITENLFAEMLKCMEPKTEFVAAPFYNSDTGCDNNITNKFERFLESNTNSKSYRYSWLFAAVKGKLFRKSFMDRCIPFDESVRDGDTSLFWLDNFDIIKGGFACLNPELGEYYCNFVRETSEEPASSGADDTALDVRSFVNERVNIIGQLERRIFESGYTINAKKLALSFIKEQHELIEQKLKECSETDRAAAMELINGYEGFYLNKGNFSESNAIAFCHNFAPYIDASSMVATRRLRQIDELSGTVHRWTVVDKNMTGVKPIDAMYDMFYASHVYSKEYSVGGKISFRPKFQVEFALRAFNRVKDLKADVIYSRALFPGSHIAAYLYKKAHPETIWYAEFSDPASRDENGEPRKTDYQGEQAIFNDFWEVVELAPYLCADHLIFTNEVQRDYMLSYNNYPEYNDSILKKSIVMNHPVIGNKFAHILESGYKMDASAINIGYFGRFYKKRSFEAIEPLCNNPNAVLHVFTNKAEEVVSDRKNVKVNKSVSFLEFLNVASKMDYVILADMDSSFGWIPWLPSKYSDYVSSGATILALVQEGSPLYNKTNEKMIKVEALDDEFVGGLEKQRPNTQATLS